MNPVGEGKGSPLARGEVMAERGRSYVLCAEVGRTSVFYGTRRDVRSAGRGGRTRFP